MSGYMKHVLIAEPNPTGHRLFYVRLLAEGAHQAGDRVTLVLGSEADPVAEEIHLTGLPEPISILRADAGSISEIARVARGVGADTVVVPDGDSLALRLATKFRWAGRATLTVLIMRERAQPSRIVWMDWVKDAVRTLAFRKVAAMRKVRLLVLKSSAWQGESRFEVAVDPVRLSATPLATQAFRRNFGIDGDRYWLAVIGAISARKNLDLVMQAMEQSGTPTGLVVAGQLDDDISSEVREQLELLRESGRVVMIDRLLTDEELDAAVAVADCIVLAHSNEGPSGLLGKAAASGTRVIAAGAKSLRDDLQALPSLGEWVPLDTANLSAAIARAVALPRPSALLDEGSDQFSAALLR